MVTVLPASPVPLIVGVRVLIRLSTVVRAKLGATVSMVMSWDVKGLQLPAASCWAIEIVLRPWSELNLLKSKTSIDHVPESTGADKSVPSM